MNEFLAWAETWWIGRMVHEIAWLFPALESLHFVGLCLMLGALLVVDLRLIGYVKFVPIKAALAFVPFIFIGFAINLVSGIAFFSALPFSYYANISFRWKMLLILLAGINAAWFWLRQQARVLASAEGADLDTDVKITAWLSLVFWVGVIVMGRLIGTVG
jgi:hypothetical protein